VQELAVSATQPADRVESRMDAGSSTPTSTVSLEIDLTVNFCRELNTTFLTVRFTVRLQGIPVIDLDRYSPLESTRYIHFSIDPDRL
jgi:hypothetical protein